MANVSKKEISEKMEALANGACLSLRLSSTFGVGAVIIELNPAQNEKGKRST